MGAELLHMMATNDYLYIDTHYAKFSVKRIKDYVTWTENVAKRFPGYIHDKTPNINCLVNISEPTVDFDQLLDFMRSKDVDRYEKEKHHFFGTTPRFLKGKAQE